MLKNLLLGLFTVLLIIGGSNMANAKAWDKTFPKSDKVNVQKIEFTNKYGITLVGDLYIPKNVNGKHAAIAISGPFGAVKEQASGLYAQTLAERGFVTLAFDPSYTGESSGTPRNIASSDINTEDFSAAVDYLSTLDIVNPNKIGILGICGFGGFAINAAAMDTRIKATTAVTMYDITRVSAKGYNDSVDENARYKMKLALNKQRTEDYKNGCFKGADGLPEKLTGKEPQFVQDYWGYYKTERGFHKRSINSNGKWNMTSSLSLINQPILQYAHEIRTPVLIVHGEKAHSRYMGEDAYKKLKGDNKELLIIKGANHVDLYYNLEKIPFDKIEHFYRQNLNNERSIKTMTDKEKYAETMMFPIGEPNTAYAKYFSGNSYLAPLSNEQVTFYNVTFEPKCRNNWHIHHATKGGGQILIGVGGRGYYQQWGKEPVEIKEGTIIHIPANVKHWHGAVPDSWFSHIAIEVDGENTSNEWLEPVTDEEYNKLK